MRTEFDFSLPRGYLDAAGQVHRNGVMRLAVARDEVEPFEDPRVSANPAYVSISLLSRVVTRIGSISPVTPNVIQELFASDFAYLQEVYLRLNESDHQVETQCPSCGTRFAIDLMSEGDA